MPLLYQTQTIAFVSALRSTQCYSVFGNYIWKSPSHYLLKVMANSSLVFTDRWQLNRGPGIVRGYNLWFTLAACLFNFCIITHEIFSRLMVLCCKWTAWNLLMRHQVKGQLCQMTIPLCVESLLSYYMIYYVNLMKTGLPLVPDTAETLKGSFLQR